MSSRYPPVRIYHEFDGERFLVVRDCVNITFYMRKSHGEFRHGVLRALEAYRYALKPRDLAWYLDSQGYGAWRPLDGPRWTLVRENVLHPKSGRITLSEEESLTGAQFEYYGRDLDSPICEGDPGIVCALSAWLPTEYLEEHGPARVRELAMEMGAELPFGSGFAGLCFQFPEDTLGPGRLLRKVCFDYPGIEIPRFSGASMRIGTRVRTVAWLNFLGQPVLSELGGASALRSRLTSPGTTVQEMEGERALVTLGPCPESGHMEPERTLAPYRELARLLEPWLYQPRAITDGFTEEDMRRWDRRFLEG